MELIESIKLELGLSGTEKDSLLNELITNANFDIDLYTNYNTANIPIDIVNNVVKKLVIRAYSKLGLGGIQYYSEAGVTYTFSEKSPLFDLYSYRKPTPTSIRHSGEDSNE